MKIKDMFKDKKKVYVVITLVVFLLLIIGAAYAYFSAQVGDGKSTDINVVTKTTDSLMFEIGDPLNIEVSDATLGKEDGNIVRETYAKATLRTSSETRVEYSYNIYLQIDNNSLGYTSADRTPELILTVTDADGKVLGDGDITTLDYVTVGEGENQVSGYDITTASGLVTIANNYKIGAIRGEKIDDWKIMITFMNLSNDQFENTNKTFTSKLMIQQGDYSNPDLYIATTYDGSAVVPSTFGAEAAIDCSGNDAHYDYKYNRMVVRTINQESASCNLKYTTPSNKDYLNQKIIGLVGNGQVVNEKGYRYEGTNPNNYIWFNNELWRIIGVFDAGTHGVTGQNLVKIIRSRSLGGYAWDKDSNNSWGDSSLNKLLNEFYYGQKNGNSSDNCYINAGIKGNCDFSSSGIASDYKDMIKNVKWYLGSFSSVLSDGDNSEYKNTAEGYFNGERSIELNAPVNGFIGLMYPSDYGYSVLSSSCNRTTKLSNYNTSECAGNSWIYGAGIEWTIMSDKDGASAYRIFDYGYVSPNATNLGREVRPVLYLDARVYVIKGTGTANDPYIIGM